MTGLVSQWVCRDADEADSEAIRAIALTQFPRETLLPEAVLAVLLRLRPALARVVVGPSANSACEIGGYHALWPMTLGTFHLLKTGRLIERDLKSGHLLSIDDPSAEVLYILDICARDGRRLGARLALDLVSTVKKTLRSRSHLSLAAAWAFSGVGADLCTRLGMHPEAASSGALWSGTRDEILSALIGKKENKAMQEIYAPAWARSYEQWAEAAKFFARLLKDDPAYISHGEIQTGLSLDGKTWAPNLEERFLAELGEFSEDRGIALVRNSKGEIVAAANVTWSFEMPESAFATLQDMAVEPALRSAGIGALLLEFVEHEAVRRGAKRIFLESGKNNRRAHAFFEREGFAEVSHVFMKPCAPKS
jgi:GNAT superfamily N-acetyltransferase